jgi:hypothetical protein
MYDKTIFEAMACGCLVLVSNDNLKGQIDERLIVEKREAEEVADRLLAVMSLSESDILKIKLDNRIFAETHSLSILVQRLEGIIS